MLVKLLDGQVEVGGVCVLLGRGQIRADYAHFVFMNCVDNVIGRQVLNTKDLTNNLTALTKAGLLCSVLPEVGFYFLKEKSEERRGAEYVSKRC